MSSKTTFAGLLVSGSIPEVSPLLDNFSSYFLGSGGFPGGARLSSLSSRVCDACPLPKG